MKHRLKRIGVLQTALTGAIVYGLISLVFVPFFLFLAMIPTPGMEEGWMIGPAFALLMPILYAVFGFIGGALGAFVYNLAAMMIGGIEIELEPVGGTGTTGVTTGPAY